MKKPKKSRKSKLLRRTGYFQATPIFGFRGQNRTVGIFKTIEHISIYYRTIVTNFNTKGVDFTTDLKWAATMMHEGMHAYLMAYYHDKEGEFVEEYSSLLEFFNDSKDWNIAHHEEFAVSLRKKIQQSLEEYAQLKGYDVEDDNDSYFEDLSWAGLYKTKAFKKLSDAEEDRIKSVNNIEQNGQDVLGNDTEPRGIIPDC